MLLSSLILFCSTIVQIQLTPYNKKTPVNYLLKFFCFDAIFYKKSNSHKGTCGTDDLLLSSVTDTV